MPKCPKCESNQFQMVEMNIQAGHYLVQCSSCQTVVGAGNSQSVLLNSIIKALNLEFGVINKRLDFLNNALAHLKQKPALAFRSHLLHAHDSKTVFDAWATLLT